MYTGTSRDQSSHFDEPPSSKMSHRRGRRAKVARLVLTELLQQINACFNRLTAYNATKSLT